MIQTFASGRNSMLCECAIGLEKSAAKSITATARARRDTDGSPGKRIKDACQCNRLREVCAQLCEARKGGACDAHNTPGLQHDGATAAVEVDRGSVPVEDVPLQPSAAALHRDGRHISQQRLADATAAMRGLYEEIFEMDAGTAPCGVDGEIKSEAGGFSLVIGDQALEERLRSEAVAAELGLADLDCVGLAFVDSECVDQSKNRGDVGFCSEADVHGDGLAIECTRGEPTMRE